MAEVDPVILEIRAELGRYKAELRSTTTSVERLLGRQEKSAKRLEAEMRRSSSAIASTLRGLAGTLAAAFTGRELVGLLDGFTRLQNNLRVAGQEGENLARVQSSLLSISQQYGVDVETLSGVFLKASLAQNELGASTEEIIRLNEIVAASLKITGTSAEEARGALLQLGQALGSDVVRGEEFNSLLENALPLVQAAARGIDRFGGSVARLRAEVVDSKVTSQEFFEGVLRGGVQTIEDAEKANLTLAGSFEALRSQLLVYFGEAGKGAGATEALTSAIESLAENLDVLIPALAAIATAVGVRMVGGAIAASSAYATLTGVLAGTTTATAALSVAMNTLARALPLVAITALITTLGYLAASSETAEDRLERLNDQADDAERKAELYRKRLEQATGAVDGLGDAATTAEGKVASLGSQMEIAAQQAFNLFKELSALGILETTGRLTAIEKERQSLVAGQRAQTSLRPAGDALSQAIAGSTGKKLVSNVDADVAALDREARSLRELLKTQIEARNAGIDISGEGEGGGGAPPAAPPPKPADGRTRTSSGPDAAEIAARQEAEIARLRAEEIQARLNLTDDIDERANLQAELDAIELAQRRADIESNADLSRAQKDAQLEILNGLFGVSGEIDEQGRIIVRGNEGLYAQIREREAQFEELRRAGQLEADTARAKEDVLRSQLSITSDREERARLERQILEIQIEAAKAELRNQIATLELAKGREKEVALLRQRLSDLDTIRANEAEGIARDNESPLQRYARGLNESDLGDEAEQLIVDEIETVRGGIRDAIADAIGTDDPLITGLLDLLLQDLIFKPLANSLANASGGGGGGFFGSLLSGLGSIFGGARASGGYVSPGTMYRVNEGASPGRVEGFRPAGSGEIIPLGQMNALANGGMRSAAGGGVAVVRLELSGDIDARIDQRSTNVAVEVTRATAPRIIDAAANETARRFSRPKL